MIAAFFASAFFQKWGTTIGVIFLVCLFVTLTYCTGQRAGRDREIVKQFTLPPATQEEIDNTVAVMGGDDWQRWLHALGAAGALSSGCKTTESERHSM